MAKRLLFVLLLSSVVLSACGPTTPPPGDQGTTVGLATVERIDILILESFPVQVQVRIEGVLGDGCTTLGEIAQARAGSTFRVKVTTERPTGAICTQIATAFDETIALDVLGLPAGTYTVDVNGVQDTFTLDVDNVSP